MLRYEIVINIIKKVSKINGNIWYKSSKNRYKRKNSKIKNLQIYIKYSIILFIKVRLNAFGQAFIYCIPNLKEALQ